MPISRRAWRKYFVALAAFVVGTMANGQQQEVGPPGKSKPGTTASLDRGAGRRALTDQYCVRCHNQRLKTGGVVLEGLDAANVAGNAGIWERVLRQVSTGQMPPSGLPRPDASTASEFVSTLEAALNRSAAEKPNPGATMPHRLNRVEYSNAVRDLLALDVRPGDTLPVDESGSGFDNMADLLSLSPTLLERYISVARTVSRMAVGDLAMKSTAEQYGYTGRLLRPDPDAEDLPLNARGGIAVRHYFPLDAEYDIRIEMAGGTGDTPTPLPYKYRVPVKAGLHSVVATFLPESTKAESPLPAGRRGGPPAAPGPDNPDAEMDLRLDGMRVKLTSISQRGTPPAIATLTIAGPFQASGRGDTPSRAKIFV